MPDIRQTQFVPRDTTSIANAELPSILHEDNYWPAEPTSIEDTGLNESLLESLICQILNAGGTLSGRKIAESVGLPFGIIDEQLSGLRTRQIVAHARSAPLNDYYYSLTENGQRRTLQHQKVCKYTGAAPVPLSDYLISVEAQANQFCPVERTQLIEALSEISFQESWLDFLGPAVNSNGGIFLYGPPGNGKTTLAKCLTVLRGESIWIPHAIIDDGMIIKLFDAAYHEPMEVENDSGLVNLQNYDRRWIRIERPTVVVGGELTLDNLEIRHDPRSNTCEAPLQLKSNCGSLLIDDFGRQRVSPAELLNRWIVPLENKQDFLTLPTGKKISVPFEQIVLFSTNLQPHDLVDEAFLRRVPFKIEINNPTPEEFKRLFRASCESMGFPWRPEVVEQLIEGFFKAQNRELRRCYPRDLLKQVKAFCTYRSEPLDLRIDYLKHACRNYFGNLGNLEPRAASYARPAVAAPAQPATVIPGQGAAAQKPAGGVPTNRVNRPQNASPGGGNQPPVTQPRPEATQHIAQVNSTGHARPADQGVSPAAPAAPQTQQMPSNPAQGQPTQMLGTAEVSAIETNEIATPQATAMLTPELQAAIQVADVGPDLGANGQPGNS